MFGDTMKRTIDKISSKWGLDFILKLQPCSWNWKAPLSDGKKHFGLIAQDVDNVAPMSDFGFVTTKEGYFALNYWEFIGPMIRSDHDLHAILVEMSERIDKLTKEVEELKKGGKGV